MKGLWCPFLYCLSSAEGASTAIIIFNCLQLLCTCLITTFCHAIYCHYVKRVVLHKKYEDPCNAFCRVADEVCPSGLRPWMVEM